MTVPIDAALTTTLGAAVYTAAQDHIPSDESLLTSPYFLWGQAYNLIVGMGIAIAAYLLNPDWMWMYWVDTTRLSPPITVYVFLLYPAMFTLGFLGADQARKLGDRVSLSLLAALIAFVVLFVLLTFGRVWCVGTISQWEAGTCVPLIGSGFAFTPLASVLAVGLILAIISGVWLLMRFSRGLD